MTDTIEVETKFSIPASSLPDVFRIHRLADFLRIEDRQARHRDIYLDTDDEALRRSDVALRWRDTAGGPLLASFKGAAIKQESEYVGIHRPEIETVVSRADVDLDREAELPIGLYSELPAFAAALNIVGDVMLRPVAAISTGRRSAIFMRTTGGQAELAIDRTVGIRLRDGASHEFIEIELEISDEVIDDLAELIGDLRTQAPDLEPTEITKLERVLNYAQPA